MAEEKTDWESGWKNWPMEEGDKWTLAFDEENHIGPIGQLIEAWFERVQLYNPVIDPEEFPFGFRVPGPGTNVQNIQLLRQIQDWLYNDTNHCEAFVPNLEDDTRKMFRDRLKYTKQWTMDGPPGGDHPHGGYTPSFETSLQEELKIGNGKPGSQFTRKHPARITGEQRARGQNPAGHSFAYNNERIFNRDTGISGEFEPSGVGPGPFGGWDAQDWNGISDTPPFDPQDGETWGVMADPKGDWFGQGGDIAVREGGIWKFHTPDTTATKGYRVRQVSSATDQNVTHFGRVKDKNDDWTWIVCHPSLYKFNTEEGVWLPVKICFINPEGEQECNEPDLVDTRGFLRDGDYIGSWLFNELFLILDALRWMHASVEWQDDLKLPVAIRSQGFGGGASYEEAQAQAEEVYDILLQEGGARSESEQPRCRATKRLISSYQAQLVRVENYWKIVTGVRPFSSKAETWVFATGPGDVFDDELFDDNGDALDGKPFKEDDWFAMDDVIIDRGESEHIGDRVGDTRKHPLWPEHDPNDPFESQARGYEFLPPQENLWANDGWGRFPSV